MSDEPIRVPVGDTSHLSDNVPPTRREVTRIEQPLEIVEPDGGTTQPIREDTGKPTSIPADVVDIQSGKEQLEVAKSIKEPCVSCRHFSWPKKGSKDWHEREAQIMGPKLRMGPDMAHIWPFGGPPQEFGQCSEPALVVEDEIGRAEVATMKGKALVHYHRPGCPNFRRKPWWRR